MPALTTSDAGLARVRAGVRATLALGIGASLAANVLAAEPSTAGRLIAAWPPLALLLTMELISRVPVGASRLSSLRLTAAGSVAAIAAWVSYWHMAEVAARFGEAPIAAHLIPLSVDGLVVVASVSLMDLSTRPSAVVTTTEEKRPSTAVMPPTKPSPPARPSPSRQRPSQPAGERVRRLARDHPEWTRKQLAEAAGCSERSVRRHLNGDVPDGPGSPPASLNGTEETHP